MADLVYYEEPRSLSEIQPVIAKLLDQIWYNRHKNLAYKIEIGDVTLVDEYNPKDHQHTVVRSVWALGNGVYLYRVKVTTSDGSQQASQIGKLAVLR